MVLDDSTLTFKRFEQQRQAYNSFLLKSIFGVLWCSDWVIWLVAVVVSSLLLVGVVIDGGSIQQLPPSSSACTQKNYGYICLFCRGSDLLMRLESCMISLVAFWLLP
jgi:hypothetical protein